MFQRSPRGRELFVVDGQVRVFDQLLYSPPKYGPSRYHGGHFLQASAGKTVIRATANRIVRLANQKSADGKPVGLWQDTRFRDPQALALTKNVVLVAGEIGAANEETNQEQPVRYGLTAIDLEKGTPLWTTNLPAAPAAWGIAVSNQGRILVTLVNGQILGF